MILRPLLVILGIFFQNSLVFSETPDSTSGELRFFGETLLRNGLANDELGYFHLNQLLEKVKFFQKPQEDSDFSLRSISHSIRHKIRLYFGLLSETATALNNVSESAEIHSSFPFCCSPEAGDSCCLISKGVVLKEEQTLESIYQNNRNLYPELQSQFLISNDLHVEFPASVLSKIYKEKSNHYEETCEFFGEILHRNVFLKTLYEKPKHVLLLIDDNDLNSLHVSLAKSFLSYVLYSLSSEDDFGLFIGDDFISPCTDRSLKKADDSFKKGLLEKVRRVWSSLTRMRGSGSSQSSILKKSHDILSSTEFVRSGETIHVLFLSRGHGLDEKFIESLKYLLMESSSIKIIFKVYGLNVVAPNRVFPLQKIASVGKIVGGGGTYNSVNSSYSLIESVGDFMDDVLPIKRRHLSYEQSSVVFSESYKSQNGKFRVFGLSVDVKKLFEELVYDSSETLFLFDGFGNLISGSKKTNKLRHFNVHTIIKGIKENPDGEKSTTNGIYAWTKIAGTPYILVSFSKRNKFKFIYESNISPYVSFHDTLGHKVCRYFRTLASTDIASLYLAPRAYIGSYARSMSHTSRQTDILEFLNNASSRNPGLTAGVKSSYHLVSSLAEYWKAGSTIQSGIFVRKYVGVSNGLLISYPGYQILNSDLDHTKEDWFISTSKSPGNTIISPPRLDPGGAGFVITLSRAIKSDILPEIVLGLDMNPFRIKTLLYESLSFCAESQSGCFLFDDGGYIVYHPLLKPSTHKKIHLTHLEPELVNNLLSFPVFLRKIVCNSGTALKRIYEFNSTYLSKEPLVSGKGCGKFIVAKVPSTNLFVGKVNSSNCAQNTISFCPCNVEGDLCIYCEESTPQECECPCSCPIPCSGYIDRFPDCPPDSTMTPPLPKTNSQLADCYTSDCISETNRDVCLNSLGCSWCAERSIFVRSKVWVRLSPGESYCGEQQECFEGRIGSPSPYSDGDSESHKNKNYLIRLPESFRSSPIGPIAGGILGVFIFLSTTVYCYRYYSGNLHSFRDEAALCSDEDFGDTFKNDVTLETAQLREAVIRLSSIEIPPNSIVSPYKMNPGYRRPPPGTDSDHGYSTMTPLGDLESEAAVSIIRGTIPESPSPKEALKHNSSLRPNQMVVSATVHMVDTH